MATTHHRSGGRPPRPVPTDPATAAEQSADPDHLTITRMTFPQLVAAQHAAWTRPGKWGAERRAAIAAQLEREGGR